MAESIAQRLNAVRDSTSAKELRPLLDAILADLTSIKTQFNQLRTDYNANATIATDTTATAITLTTTS